MNYKIKVNRMKDESGNIKALANVVFGEALKVSSIAIVEGKNGLYVQMPSYKTKEVDQDGKSVYKDFCNPITKGFREELYGNILKAYEENSTEEMYVGYTKDDKCQAPDYDLIVTPFERDGNAIKGLVTVFLEEKFVINNVNILQGKGDAPFVSMPAYRSKQQDENGKNVYHDVCFPVTKEFREKLYGDILKQYEKEKEERGKKKEGSKGNEKETVGKKKTKSGENKTESEKEKNVTKR